MKKILSLLTLSMLFFMVAGCEKDVEHRTLLLDQSEVKKTVYDWGIYTNPQFRYELRVPKDWVQTQTTEGGEEVTISPKRKTVDANYPGGVKIFGYVNWNKQYSLEQFYQNKDHDLFKEGFQNEQIDFKGEKAIWFKNVDTIYPGRKIDVVVFHLDDRIIEFYLIDDWDKAINIFNSMYFYGNNTITIDE